MGWLCGAQNPRIAGGKWLKPLLNVCFVPCPTVETVGYVRFIARILLLYSGQPLAIARISSRYSSNVFAIARIPSRYSGDLLAIARIPSRYSGNSLSIARISSRYTDIV